MIGTQLDKYEVLQKIGEGGMATVYRGRHATLRRDVAIKVLHPHLSSSTRNRKRFAREARAIEHLRHDNILEIFDYSGVDTGDCYIITEFVAGETLTELMSRCRHLPSEVTVSIGLALTEALDYAHGAGILHRDLKPDNVMMRDDGQIKLMDFGIARFLDESQVTLTGALVGSPAFMSPEQAREDSLDTRSDLFSLGTLLFYLVTGHLPFSGSNASVILKNIIEGNRPHITELAPSMSASLADVVEQLLSVHREDRQNSARQVYEQLLACHAEVGFDHTEPKWTLSRYLDEPAAYSEDLERFLCGSLLERGRGLMGAGEQLSALRLFNRLLSMDEDNEEALSLIQDFHGVQTPAHRNRVAWLVSAALLAVGALGVVWLVQDVPTTGDDAPDRLLKAPVAVAPEVPAVTDAADDAADVNTEVDMPPSGVLPAAQDATAPAPPDKRADDIQDEVTPAKPVPRLPDAGQVLRRASLASLEASKRRADATASESSGAPPAADDASDASASPGDPPDGQATSANDAEVQEEPACVGLRSLVAPAEIYLDDTLLGTTRDKDCQQLAAGTYRFVLRGEMIEEKTVEVTLAPGEVRDPFVVELTRLPGRVRFPVAYADNCVVWVDGVSRGPLGELPGRQVMIEHPERKHVVATDCKGRKTEVEYAQLRYATTTFKKPGGRP